MIWTLIIIAVLIILIMWAVRSRVFLSRSRSREIDGTLESPASLALAQLIAIAGGIYLSLVLLTSFLKLDLPEKILITNDMVLDPLALGAIIIALFQPIFLCGYYRLFKK